MDGYMAKPIRPADLLSLLHQFAATGSQMRPAPAAIKPLAAFDPSEILARVEGDLELLAELVEIFDGEAPQRLSEIRRCMEVGDANGLERAAHALRGSVASFGAHPAAQAAHALEIRGRDGAFAGAEVHVAELAHELSRLQIALASFTAREVA
jgi:HPt (histidine-containing phosphotransfer) domain-containing protein